MSANYFYALVYKDGTAVNVRKFTYDFQNGPFFSVPTEQWSLALHPRVELNLKNKAEFMSKMRSRRSVRMEIVASNGKRSTEASLYLTADNRFKVGSIVLEQEQTEADAIDSAMDIQNQDIPTEQLNTLFSK